MTKSMMLVGLAAVLGLLGLGCGSSSSNVAGSGAALTTNGVDDDHDGTIDEANEADLAKGKGDHDGDHQNGNHQDGNHQDGDHQDGDRADGGHKGEHHGDGGTKDGGPDQDNESEEGAAGATGAAASH